MPEPRSHPPGCQQRVVPQHCCAGGSAEQHLALSVSFSLCCFVPSTTLMVSTFVWKLACLHLATSWCLLGAAPKPDSPAGFSEPSPAPPESSEAGQGCHPAPLRAQSQNSHWTVTRREARGALVQKLTKSPHTGAGASLSLLHSRCLKNYRTSCNHFNCKFGGIIVIAPISR